MLYLCMLSIRCVPPLIAAWLVGPAVLVVIAGVLMFLAALATGAVLWRNARARLLRKLTLAFNCAAGT